MTFDPLKDIEEFKRKFGFEYKGPARALPKELGDLRYGLLDEEVQEYRGSQVQAYDETTKPPECRDQANYTHELEEALDGLVDLVYVALGTAYLHGFDFAAAWERVHEANMSKVRTENPGDSKRGSSFDVVKPEGWEPPSHTDLVEVNDCMMPYKDRA